MSLRMLAPIGLALTLSSAYADPTANKKTVVDFYEKAINQKDFDAASRYLGSRYIQHNPQAADGAARGGHREKARRGSATRVAGVNRAAARTGAAG